MLPLNATEIIKLLNKTRSAESIHIVNTLAVNRKKKIYFYITLDIIGNFPLIETSWQFYTFDLYASLLR